MSSYYDDEDDLDIHVRRRGHSPGPIRYVQSPPQPRSYYGVPSGPSYLVPQQHTTVVARSRSRERLRSHGRRESSPGVGHALIASPANPVIINNRVYNEFSSDDDGDNGSTFRRSRRQRGSRSRSRSRSKSSYMTRDDWEAEQARRDLEQLRIVQARDKDERRLAKEYKDEAELQRAKRELDEIKKREAHAEEERRIKKELELKRLREEEEAAMEKQRRDKEAAEAIEKYKKDELERLSKEEKRKKENEEQYKRRLQDDLLKSGLDEKAITAILSNNKIPSSVETTADRPTYTRMARRHLSIETLRTFHVEYDLDLDPEFILIKRWVPEWEQDQLWMHTKHIREKRGRALLIEEKKHHRHEPEFEWVRKKNDRKRSKSPSLLMYLAGGRPA